MQLSIAIVSWNTRELLRGCLKSVFENLAGIEAEVIVVDNGSSDGSCDMVRSEFPGAKLIEAGRNLGFARANNLAYGRSSSRYFLLLNSDTIVLPDALQALAAFLDSHPKAGAAAARLLNGDGSLQRSCSPFPTPLTELFDALYLSKLFPRSRLFGRYAMTYWDFDEVREVDFAGGSCLMLRRDALEQIGLLDQRFFMYSEETDICYRLNAAGWKVYFIPDAKVIHYGGQSARLDAVRTSVELCRSKYRFMKKHYGHGRAVEYRAVVALASLLRIAAIAPSSLFGRNRGACRERVRGQGKLLKWAVTQP